MDARGFKTALANGELTYINKREKMLAAATVDRVIRESRTMFGRLVADELISSNPFAGLSKTVKVEKRWHYLDREQYEKIISVTSDINWKVLVGLCRMAGLRRGEALNLEWLDVDWHGKTLQVIAKQDWKPKDRSPRTVPICPNLGRLLLEAYDKAADGPGRVVCIRSLAAVNRDFFRLLDRAGVPRYSKPFHTLRKNCITDWAQDFPMHVVKEWAGHSSLVTTDEYYLKVSPAEYKSAAEADFWGGPAEKNTQPEKNIGLDKDEPKHITIRHKGIGDFELA